MHKLDPIERLPDGTIFRLAPGQLRSVRGLTKRRCKVCGTGILARSGRAKYCPTCAKNIHRQQKAKSAHKRRSGVDSLGAKSP